MIKLINPFHQAQEKNIVFFNKGEQNQSNEVKR